MIVQGVRCPSCGDEIWSRSGHDYRHCSCGDSFVDGGRHYLRYGGKVVPEIIDIEVPDAPSKRK